MLFPGLYKTVAMTFNEPEQSDLRHGTICTSLPDAGHATWPVQLLERER